MEKRHFGRYQRDKEKHVIWTNNNMEKKTERGKRRTICNRKTVRSHDFKLAIRNPCFVIPSLPWFSNSLVSSNPGKKHKNIYTIYVDVLHINGKCKIGNIYYQSTFTVNVWMHV